MDTAIAGIRALLAKHDRIKIGLLQDLLTRGVDREGRLRDPAEEKFKTTPLGQVPCEWRVSNLGSVSNKITSGSRGWALITPTKEHYFFALVILRGGT